MKRLSRVDKCMMIYLFIMFLIYMNFKGIYGDLLFLENRIKQVADCFKDFNYPFFYYNDFFDLGYGSSFFYGQLTLFPFSLLSFIIGLDNATFVYICVTIYLLYFSLKFFIRRFNKINTDLVVLSVFFSETFMTLIYGSCLYANNLGIAIGFIFLGYCIDFFRDNKNLIKCSLVFLLLFNTHLITSVICFLICIFLLFYYFDKSRLKDYCKFALLCSCLCLYNIVNILYHYSSIGKSGNIFSMEDLVGFCSDLLFINSPVLKYCLLHTNQGIILFSILDVILIIFSIRNSRRLLFSSKKLNIILTFSLLGSFLSIYNIWYLININFSIFIQFPIRYLPFCICFVHLFFFRYINSKAFKRFLYICFIFMSVFYLYFEAIPQVGEKKIEINGLGTLYASDDNDKLTSYEVMNGEYFGSDYFSNMEDWKESNFKELSNLKSNVTDNYNNKYDYDINDGVLSVDLSGNNKNDLIIRVPKVYYKGYIAKTEDDEYLEISSNEYGLCDINVGNYSGVVYVYYSQPLLLSIIFVFELLFISFVLLHLTNKLKFF